MAISDEFSEFEPSDEEVDRTLDDLDDQEFEGLTGISRSEYETIMHNRRLSRKLMRHLYGERTSAHEQN